MAGRPQTIDRAKVRTLVGQRLNDVQIAERLRCKPGSITHVRNKLGLAVVPQQKRVPPAKTWTQERVTQLRIYWDIGISASEIARRLGPEFGKNSVLGAVHRHNLPPRASPIHGGPTQHKGGRSRKQPPGRDLFEDNGPSLRNRIVTATRHAKARTGPDAQPRSVPGGSPETSLPRVDLGQIRASISVPHPADRNVTFADLAPRGCKWATTPHHVRADRHRFCNALRLGEKSWCADHAEKARGRSVTETA